MKPAITLRKHSLDISEDKSLLIEIKLMLRCYQNLLEELLRVDLEHNWGYAYQFNERLISLNSLLEKLK